MQVVQAKRGSKEPESRFPKRVVLIGRNETTYTSSEKSALVQIKSGKSVSCKRQATGNMTYPTLRSASATRDSLLEQVTIPAWKCFIGL